MRKRFSLRLIFQLTYVAITNGFLYGFVKGGIYQGRLKYFCAPGLNCWSCPGALFSCPLGALQAVVSGRKLRFSLYVIGLMTFFGVVAGRFICGFLCPFGLFQDLLFKIPVKGKFLKLPAEIYLRKIKYFILFVFVIILPIFFIDEFGSGVPWFCKYICPAGVLEGSIPLLIVNKSLRSSLGFLFRFKFLILICISVLSIFLYRPFCRYFCPLGLFYGFFNKISVLKYNLDIRPCRSCRKCFGDCNLGLDVFNDSDSPDCIRCSECFKHSLSKRACLNKCSHESKE